MDYLIKSSIIIGIFYICYRLFLQRETFFASNRWFFIIGLVTAVCLPMVVIPIYIEYTPITNNTPTALLFTETLTTEVEMFDWVQLLTWLYLIVTSFFVVKLIIELASLQQLIINNPKRNIGRFSLIEIFDQIAPFSFFKWIVYNPKQFKQQELKHIINHEKIHAKEYHSIDILLAQICCALFWFNPFVWLYKLELQQNLEFIADQKAQIDLENKASYQRLLLKASVPNHPLVFTNNFYNSLIKKRIIMLHKSKSKKHNAWKYVLIIPVLALFLMSFNTKEIYIAKDVESKTILAKEFVISAQSSESELEEVVNYFRNKLVKVKFSDVSRNEDNTIKSLTLNTKHDNGTDYTKRITVSEKNNKIPTFKLSYSPGNDDIILNVIENDSKTVVSKQQVTFGKNKTTSKIRPKETAKKDEKPIGDNPLYIIGDKQYKKDNLPNKKLTTNGSIEVINKIAGEKRFGKAGKDGAVIVNGNATFQNIKSTSTLRRGEIIINKDFSEADLNLAKAQLEKEGIKTKIRGVKRNTNGEIIAIKIEVSSEHSKASFNLNDDGPINPIRITFGDGGKNISIGSGRSHNSHVYVARGREARNIQTEYRIQSRENAHNKATEARVNRAKYRARIISDEDHDHECESDCNHDEKIIYEFHTDDHDGNDENIVVKGSNTFVVKGENAVQGKSVVTIINEDGKEEVIELKEKDNVYILKPTGNNINATNAVWVSDEDGKKTEIKLKNIKGKSFFISNDNDGTPYILLDGKEITRKELYDLDSDSIKNMNVLKGDSATKKYGNKAKDGAIIITTKE